MKRFLSMLLCICILASLGFPTALSADDEEVYVEINEETFPDPIFRTVIWGHVDTNADGKLSESEISSYIALDFNDIPGIKDITGIEYLTGLVSIDFSNTMVTSADLSSNVKATSIKAQGCQLTSLKLPKTSTLLTVWCHDNKLTSLDVSGNPNLVNLTCSGNELEGLDVSNNTSLSFLDCSDNKISSLNLDNNKKLVSLVCSSNEMEELSLGTDELETRSLKVLDCHDNKLTSLDISCNSKLLTADCSDNLLTILNIRSNDSLQTLDCSSNRLATLNLSGSEDIKTLNCSNNRIQALDASKNLNLYTLNCSANLITSLTLPANGNAASIDCSNNKLTALDTTQNKYLISLNCEANGITALDLSKNTVLTTLNCKNNELTALDVTALTALTTLNCSDNKVNALDISKNTALTTLNCAGCGLSEIDLEKNTSLTEINCSSNELQEIDLSKQTNLSKLDVGNNLLTLLDLSGNTALQSLVASNNYLPFIDLTAQLSLMSCECEGNRYEIITDADGKYDLTKLPGKISAARISNLQNAAIEDTVITVDDINNDITYTYTMGAITWKETFALYIDARTVVFDPNGGHFTGEQGAKQLDDNTGLFGELPTPEREGYEFEGWYTAKNGGTLVTAESSADEIRARKLYAHWDANEYDLTFDPNGGECSVSSVTVTYDDTWNDLPEPTLTGYSFEGWYNDDGELVSNGDTVKILSDGTLTAHWTANTYTVTFDVAEGDALEESTKTVTYDAAYGELPEATRTGYSFLGWFIDAETEITAENTVAITEDTTLTAHWDANEYTVSFAVNGGNALADNEKTVTYDSAYGELPEATRTGYTFLGWFIDAETEITAEDTVAITENITLTAHWDANEYTVTFDAKGGECLAEPITVTYDSTYGELPKATYGTKFFLGWYLTEEGGDRITSDTKVAITENCKLYAQWSEDELPISENIFPDDALRTCISYQLDTNTDGSLNQNELAAAEALDCSDSGVKSLDGIEYLTALKDLNVSGNDLAEADFSALTELEKLDCSDNSLTQLDISANAALKELDCSGNELAEGLNVSANTALERLNCSDCGLTALHVSANTALKELDCSGNELADGLDVSANTALEKLNCSDCALTALNVSANTALTELDVSKNALKELDVSANTALVKLNCSENQLVCLDLTANTALTSVICEDNSRTVSADKTSGTINGAQLASGFDGARLSELVNASVDGNNVTVTDPSSDASYSYDLGGENGTATFTLTLEAKTLNLKMNGGDDEDTSITVYDGYTLGVCGTLPTPARTGYTFDGWYTAETNGTEVTDSTLLSAVPTDSVYAHWKANEYTATFDPGDGEVTVSSKTVTYGLTYGELPTPTQAGYDFDGWYTSDQADATLITADSTVAITDNTTLYARWSPATFTITFDANKGTVDPASMDVDYLSQITGMPTPTLAGYEFLGWFTDAEEGTEITNGSTYTYTDDIKLYAHWKAATYTVSYNTNGGRLEKILETTLTVTYGEKWEGLQNATKSNYDFVGWFTEKEGGKQIKNGDTVEITENTTIYAHWTPKQFTVTFDAGEGTCLVKEKTVTYGETYGTLPTPSRYGYSFEYWYDKTTGKTVEATTTVKLSDDTTLIAKWKANEYTVTFNPMGGECEIETMTVYYGQAYSDQMPTPTKLGYGFDGWYTGKTAGTKITAATTCKLTADQTLYAHWKAKQYMVSFDANGGICEWSAKEYTYNQKLGELPTPTREGYTFKGWYTEKTGGTVVTVNTTMTYTSNVTLHAQWTPVSGTLTLDPNGGTCSTKSKTVQYEQPYGTLPTPSFPGHAFNGWYTEKQGGDQVTKDSLVETIGNFTIYAHWISNGLSVSFDANGGVCSTASKSVTYGKAYGTLPTPTYNGYTFEGWYTEITGGTRITAESTVTILENTTLYAHWCADKNVLRIDSNSLANGGSVWLDGVEYTADKGGVIYLKNGENVDVAVIYTYNSTSETDKHKVYPTGMEVWFVTTDGSGMRTATHQTELDNVLQYAGSSIRIKGVKGIRMITGIPAATRSTLIDSGVAGYKLVEYGTAVGWKDKVGSDALVLGKSYCLSNYAYKRGSLDAIYAKSSSKIQYTNVLTGFSDEQCKPDLLMRSYMILENDAGKQITVYGGIIERSIGYIAYQNMNAFSAGTESYEYIWHIIHAVYGNQYDSQYKG